MSDDKWPTKTNRNPPPLVLLPLPLAGEEGSGKLVDIQWEAAASVSAEVERTLLADHVLIR